MQMLEVIRLEGHSIGQEDAFMPRDIHLLQVLLAYALTFPVWYTSQTFLKDNANITVISRCVVALMKMQLEPVRN